MSKNLIGLLFYSFDIPTTRVTSFEARSRMSKNSLVALLLIWYTNYAYYFFRSSEQNEQKPHWLLFYSFDIPTCYCTTIWNRLLHNTSQINSWVYYFSSSPSRYNLEDGPSTKPCIWSSLSKYLWSHFLRRSERYLQTLPFSTLQRFKLTDLPLMSMTLKLQTDVTSSIYPSFLIFFRVDATDQSIDFFASTVDKIFQKISILMTSYLIIPH